MRVSKSSSRGKAAPPPNKRRTFALAGRSAKLDGRINAYRSDIADIALADRVFAPYYAVPVVRETIADVADLHKSPSGDSELGSQLLQGETFAVLDSINGWSWGYATRDHYVGYVRNSALGGIAQPVPVAGDGDADIVSVAETLLDAPYLWGGRSAAGIDCSGLVQFALAAAGISAPRDSDLQLETLGSDIAEGDNLRRGDLIFFPDHVGIMTDAERLVHATRHWGKVVIEPLAGVVARIAAEHPVPVIGRRRIAR